jgi:hypothetical protein
MIYFFKVSFFLKNRNEEKKKNKIEKKEEKDERKERDERDERDHTFDVLVRAESCTGGKGCG